MRQVWLICENPKIYNDVPQYAMWLRGLRRIGCATVENGIFIVDWDKVADAPIHTAPNVGNKGYEKIREWSQSAQHRLHVDAANQPQAGATCPHCHQPIILVVPETPRQ